MLAARWIALCLTGLVAACGSQPAANQPPPLPVEVAVVSRVSGDASASYPARIAYDREAVLSARLGGVVRAMPVAVGERLGAKALVAMLDATPPRAALARADAEADRTARDAARDAALVQAGAIAAGDAQDAAAAARIAAAARTAARYDLASAQITMPFAGVVLAKTADIGTTLGPGQPVATVADLASPLIARAALPAAAIRGIRHGDIARVTCAGAEFAGRVLRVGAVADAASGTVEVDVALRAGVRLPSGTPASVQFASAPAGAAGGAQHIPAEALVDAHGGTGHVYLVDPRGNIARLTPIRIIGPADDDLMVAGLPEGARVITAGAGFVTDGQPVSVLGR